MILQILLSSKERRINERPVNCTILVVLADAGKTNIATQIGVKVVLYEVVEIVEISALTDPRPITAVIPDVLVAVFIGAVLTTTAVRVKDTGNVAFAVDLQSRVPNAVRTVTVKVTKTVAAAPAVRTGAEARAHPVRPPYVKESARG